MEKTWVGAVYFSHRHMADGAAEIDPRTIELTLMSADDAVLRGLRDAWEGARRPVIGAPSLSLSPAHAMRGEIVLEPSLAEAEELTALLNRIAARVATEYADTRGG